MDTADYATPMNALRMLRKIVKIVEKKLMAGQEITGDDFVELAGTVMIANSVKGIDDQPPMPYPFPEEQDNAVV